MSEEADAWESRRLGKQMPGKVGTGEAGTWRHHVPCKDAAFEKTPAPKDTAPETRF